MAPAVQLCPSEEVVLGPPAYREPLQVMGAAPQHIPQESTGTGRHSILLHTGKQWRMWFQSKVPRSAISEGASWEQGLCEDCSHTVHGAVVGAEVVGRGGTNSTAEKVPTHGATLGGKGTPPQRVRTCDMPPPCPAEQDQMPGAGIGVSGSEQGGSVCELAGTGQGQEVLAGGWEGAGAVSAAQLGRERCQRIPGAAGQRERGWAQGKCAAIADLPRCPSPWSRITPGQPRPHGVPGRAPASRGHSQAGPPHGSVLPARLLSPGSRRTPWHSVPAGTVPACRPVLGLRTDSPGPSSPKGAAAHWVQPRNQCGTGTGGVRGGERGGWEGDPLSPPSQAQEMHFC